MTMERSIILLVLVATSLTAEPDGSLKPKYYRFKEKLDESYWLYWNFSLQSGTIDFAVLVNTTGWIGFGVSPTGQMSGSDVVIGWVNSTGGAEFHDRFAFSTVEPRIDVSQDWFLVGSSEEDGWTLLEFTRNLTNCDEEDLDIGADTTRVVWSWNPVDPSSTQGLDKHTKKGSKSVNLLGGLNEDRIDPGGSYFDITNTNLTIPSNKDTTYWCKVFRLPEEVRNAEKYIYKTSPVLSDHPFSYVHHMLVFLCVFLHPDDFTFDGDCDGPNASMGIEACINSKALGSWAIGGGDFVFPNDVAFPVGGPSNTHFVVLQIHYDNPMKTPEVVDSSGMRFFYSQDHPTHRAGILTVGHDITKIMVIPPTANGYTVSGLCPASCTENNFPADGINAFANIFHTHLIGSGVTLRHLTQSDPSCDGWKELKPIDQNMHYDFNFQQFNILQNITKIMPGDAMIVDCLYKSTRDGVTLGGEKTSEEMCLSFLMYYPDIELGICVSQPSLQNFQSFNTEYIQPELHEEVIRDLETRNESQIIKVFNDVQWTNEAVNDLETFLHRNIVQHYCITEEPTSYIRQPVNFPQIQCPYQEPPNECSRLNQGNQGRGFKLYASSVTIFIAILYCKLFIVC